MPTCLEWATERTEECTETRDEGYNECSEWRSECCDWWPCSWACEVVSWFCFAYRWVENIACVGWTVITTTVCVGWDVITTIINVILVTIESILGWVLSLIAAIIELLEMIPILGTIIRWLINIVTFVIWTIASIVDFVGGLLGIRPEKILRVCTVILRDEKGNAIAPVENMVALLQMACNVYKRDANVRIVPMGPFHYASGFGGAETVTSDWVSTASGSSDSDMLDPPCDAGGEWWLGGSKFQAAVTASCFYGAWRRVTGYGAPLAIFAVRDVEDAGGCALWITDYTVVEAGTSPPPPNLSVAGHELGHACNLWHLCVDDDIRNLMATGKPCEPDSDTRPDTDNPHMADWQALLVRASKHVTYF
jgi:hypothetical protein